MARADADRQIVVRIAIDRSQIFCGVIALPASENALTEIRFSMARADAVRQIVVRVAIDRSQI